VFAQDSTSTVGAGKTALIHSDITAYYVRDGGVLTALTMETIATLGTWASTGDNYLGFKLLHDTNAPGLYELHFPNNILATGANGVVIYLRATGMAPLLLQIQLTSPTRGLAGTALPNAAADAAGGLAISDAGGLDLDALLDAAVSSRMATYTQPTGFLAATFPTGMTPTQAEVLAIQNNTRVRVIVPPAIERPDAGSTTYRLWLHLYDEIGNMEAPDALPTITAQNNTGTDRSSGLSAVTTVSTGVYYVDYTVASTHAIEGLLFQWSIVEGGVTRLHGAQALVVDTTAVDFTADDRTKLTTLATDYSTARAALIDNLDAAITTRAAAELFTGMTSLPQWLGAMAGKQTADATALTEIKATGNGSGTFSPATDSGEGINTYLATIYNGLAVGHSTIVGYVDCLPATLDGSTLTSLPNMTLEDGAITDAKIATDALAAAKFAAAACNKFADHILRRLAANIEASGDGDAVGLTSLYSLIQQLQESNTTTHAGKLTVFKTDGTTELGQLTPTTDADADPITGIS